MISEKSPCVNICNVQRDICVGCGRHIHQIGSWSIYSNYEKREINKTISQKKTILILEDAQYRIDDFIKNINPDKYILILVKHVEDCIFYLKTKTVDVLSLDHDLNGKRHVKIGEDETGYDVAVFLKDNPEYKPHKIFVHSKFEQGILNIIKLVPEAKEIPFLWEKGEDFYENI